MKRLLAIALLTTFSASAEEGLRSGHATAQWLVGKQQDGILETVVRLRVDDHWHVYWNNPGDAGMPTSVELKLPEGWAGSGLIHPTPKKFKTGELHGFGHEGTVDYGLTLSLPEQFKGDAKLEATVSWLTCNDDACVAGEMTLSLNLKDGKVAGPIMDEKDYGVVESKFPAQAGRMKKTSAVHLKLEDAKNHWRLKISNPANLELDPAKTEVFIETQELVPASAEVKFNMVGDHWEAKAPKGEFAPEFAEECAIVLVQKGKPALRLEWKRN